MKVLLLGATGLLGHNVLLSLLEHGHNVVALVRSSATLRDIDSTDLSVVKGSILDKDDLLRAAEGCESIINCSGTTDMALLRYKDYLPVNRDLCSMLVELMDETGIKSLVHVSTANTIGYGSASKLADENEEMQPPFSHSFYALSKKEGESLLESTAQQNAERHIIILNPGFMVGPYDVKPSSGKLLLAAYKKPLMAAPRGGKSFVHVKDVAEAAVNAMTMGCSGQRYLLTGENMSLKDFYALQSEVCGYRQRMISLPNLLVSFAGCIGDIIRFLHIPTQLSTRNVRQLQVMEYYDNSKAVRELNMPQTPIAEAIREFYKWRKKQEKTDY